MGDSTYLSRIPCGGSLVCAWSCGGQCWHCESHGALFWSVRAGHSPTCWSRMVGQQTDCACWKPSGTVPTRASNDIYRQGLSWRAGQRVGQAGCTASRSHTDTHLLIYLFIYIPIYRAIYLSVCLYVYVYRERGRESSLKRKCHRESKIQDSRADLLVSILALRLVCTTDLDGKRSRIPHKTGKKPTC